MVAAGLFAFWVVLSGKLDPVHLGMGAVTALGVAWLSGGLLYSEVASDEGAEPSRRWLTSFPWWRLGPYVLWLLWEIVKANIQVLRLVLGPQSRLSPRLFDYQTRLRGEAARAAFANSITLTPGTVTVEADAEGLLRIHAIDAASAEGLMSGDMERRVAWAFGEELPPR